MIVLSHALGCDLSMWDEVAAQLAREFTVLRFDHRGHGRSEAVAGPCSIEDLADDAATLLQREAQDSVHFVGLSLGGMVAQQIAAQEPQLVSSIVVANSSSHYDETFRGMWRSRQETALNLGMSAIAETVMPRWFTRPWRESANGALRMRRMRGVLEAMDPKTYAAGCDAVARIDFSGSNPQVACPALVIAGVHDEATPPAMSEVICNTISGAELATLETAHLSAVERPEEFASLVAEFVKRV
ncbi:3-oxoadipate enol-lactonase [Ramlibacter solisilvae]